jgi:hypothetical protein
MVKELTLKNFKEEFAEYFTVEGAEMLYTYLSKLFQNEKEAIKKQFDFILFEDMHKYDEEELNIIAKGSTGVLVEW